MSIVKGQNEEERLKALRALEIVRSGRVPEYDAVVDAIADIFECPIALISLVEEEEQWFKARRGLDAEGTPRAVSFCQHAILQDDVFIVEDAQSDPRFVDNALVTGAPHIRFYAGCPLSVDGANRLGTLCVIDREPRNPTAFQIDQLRRMGTIVEGLIKSHQAQLETGTALEEAEKQRKSAARRGSFLEEITSVTGVGGWELDLGTEVLTWSKKTREIHEVGPNFEPKVDAALSFYAPECRQEITDAVSRGMAEGVDWDLELPFITAKGRNIWVRAVGRPIFEDGKIVRLVGSFQDITSRKEIERAIESSEAIHRTTLDALSEGTLLLNCKGEIRSFNPSVLQLLDLGSEQLLGKRITDLGLELECDGERLLKNPFETAVSAPQDVENVVIRVKRPSKSDFVWLRLNAKEISSEKTPDLDGVVVSLTDISIEKRQSHTLDMVVKNLPGGLVYYDRDLRLTVCNRAFKEQLRIITDEEPVIRERTGPTGRELEIRGVRLADGSLVYSFYDVSERKRMAQRLFANERLARSRTEELEAVLGNMRQGVSVFDSRGRLKLWNQQYIDIYDKPFEDVYEGVTLIELIQAEKERGEFHGDVQEHVLDLLMRLLDGEVVHSKFKHPNGRIVSTIHAPLPEGGWIGTHEDVTRRETALEKIEYAAHHDILTGLANRNRFNERLQETIDKMGKTQNVYDLLLLDLDEFKPVNDDYGHDVGDLVLKEVARRLKEVLSPSDFVGKIGGDEFGLLLRRTSKDTSSTAELAGRIVESIKNPIFLDGRRIKIGASIGITPLDDPALDGLALVKRADIALYQVKNSGRGAFKFFESDEARRAIG